MDIFNKIWRRRGRPTKGSSQQSEEYISCITRTDRDYSELLTQGDVAIKFWLPEIMDTILDESCKLLDTTRSDLIRQVLFTYLYGRYDWLGMVERSETHYQLNQEPKVFYQRTIPNLTRDMGKNTEDLKVWIPSKMKKDIEALAAKTDISLSEMIREIMISTMIGHTYLSARDELLQMKIEIEDFVAQ
ncbi:hypothetical protein [Mariprofundus sp. KV]|uniref:hypothetical protein n=1 Tax=Mariprofundus sp. KV TaxID=2608715 RepID=UPI0015A0FDC5|nr:hypothetical protein [Mariprofundus sp. KV]NWF37275.1 hypothetical protein [Mariprofundus sp. KV]